MPAKHVPLSQVTYQNTTRIVVMETRSACLSQWAQFFGRAVPSLPSYDWLLPLVWSQCQLNFCCMDFVFELCFPNVDSQIG